jgi:uncharacterized protein with GYD domain
MATYVSLVRYTEQGIRNIKESPNRLDATKKLAQSLGGELKQFYLAMGKYDIVVVSEAPDDETAARFALSLGSAGNVRTETMRVFGSGFRKIVDRSRPDSALDRPRRVRCNGLVAGRSASRRIVRSISIRMTR